MGLVVTVCDYAIRLFGSYARHPEQGDKWTGKDEKKLEEICRTVVSTQDLIVSSTSSFFQMRNTRTKTVSLILNLLTCAYVYSITVHILYVLFLLQYYAITITSLLILSFLGSMINNLFLSYLVGKFNFGHATSC